MNAVILDQGLARNLIARRKRLGLDMHDEVWEGVYFVSPSADINHQRFSVSLASVFYSAVTAAGLGESLPVVNVSDRKEGWEKNFRVPDIAVFLNGTGAEDCGTFWFGGPDFVVEFVSPGDRTRKKLPFYESVGTRELLIVDRKPWRLTLFHLTEGKLVEAGQSTFDDPQQLVSRALPLNFRLAGELTNPAIEVTHQTSGQKWLVQGRVR